VTDVNRNELEHGCQQEVKLEKGGHDVREGWALRARHRWPV
jgi:hypothetical protein